jgi:hypothetical protein
VPREKTYSDNAARVAAFRLRHDVVTLSVAIPRELAQRLDAHLRFKNVTKASVIIKLIESQILRKR